MNARHAVAASSRRDRGLLRVGTTVYVWRVPTHVGEPLRVRRIDLAAPVRPVQDDVVFGADPDDDVDPGPAPRRVQADRLRRLQARAALYATPATLCATQDVADVFGVREADVRAARPASARRVGRAWMAPFGDWLVALGIDLVALAEPPAERLVPRTRAALPPTLRPLGGPAANRR